MKKRSTQIVVLILIGLFVCQNINGQLQREGILKHITNYPSNISLSKEYPIERKERKIWFLDSSVIWEHKINITSEEPAGDTGTIIKYSYPVSKYVYFDLRTRNCQDYLTLKDTATPHCNYKIANSDISELYGFFFPKKYSYPLDSLDVFFNLTDTVINNTNFKRVGRLRMTYAEGYIKSIFYLNCNMPKTIFHFGNMDKDFDAKYPDCQIVKSELVFDTSGIILGGIENEFITYKLTKEERLVFSQWQKNAANTQLPLLSYYKAERIPIRMPEHENPVIRFIPKPKRFKIN